MQNNVPSLLGLSYKEMPDRQRHCLPRGQEAEEITQNHEGHRYGEYGHILTELWNLKLESIGLKIKGK